MDAPGPIFHVQLLERRLWRYTQLLQLFVAPGDINPLH